MQILGEWYLCDDGVERPVIRGEVLGANGSWVHVELLVDSGADRTVFTADILTALGLPYAGEMTQLGGLGGAAEAVFVDTQIRLTNSEGGKVTFHGSYAAIPESLALDMSVLGRDVLSLFALIIDYPGRALCLLGPRHQYRIEWQ